MKPEFQQERLKKLMSSDILRQAAHFAKREGGSVTLFSLLIFISMMMMVGMTIDMMRHEAVRTRLQSTADRAVLAAADLDQQAHAKDVVLDYFEKAGLKDFVDPEDIVVDDDAINYKSVSARVDYTMPTWFLNMSGIDTLSAGSYSKAEEKIQNIEVSLVLDISGSMGDPSATAGKTKMEAMQEAAVEFADIMMKSNPADLDPTEGITSVSVIPYHGTVNAGETLVDELSVSYGHGYSYCIDFSSSQRRVPEISTSTSYDQLGHFDYRTSSYYDVGGNMTLKRPFCQTDDYGEILMHSVSYSDLETAINSLEADGWTAIDLGLKWGAALIDPSTRPITNTLEAANVLHESVQDRPVDYTPDDPNATSTAANTVKVIVLMTDGANTRQYDLETWAKSGLSPVWYSEDEDQYSSYFAHRASWGYAPWWIPSLDSDGDVNVSDGYWSWNRVGSDAVQIEHQELFSLGGLDFISDYFFRTTSDSGSNKSLRHKYRYADTYWGYSSADTNATTLCSNLKQKNVVIYSIAFEAPSGGKTLMQSCASKPGNYFDVNAKSISQAFKAIADNIQQLRLTF